MARIKITGYIDTDDLAPEFVDLAHESGLSSQAFEDLASGSGIDYFQAGKSLDDVEAVLEP